MFMCICFGTTFVVNKAVCVCVCKERTASATTFVNWAPMCLSVLLKALSDAEQERSFLQEKLMSVERESSAASAEHGRQKREMVARQDQQSQRIDCLQLELKTVQQHLEHTMYALAIAVFTCNREFYRPFCRTVLCCVVYDSCTQ